jgi:hypothetical protein
MAEEKFAGSGKASRRRARKKLGKMMGRRKKEFTFRGYTLDELKALTMEDLAGRCGGAPPMRPASSGRPFERATRTLSRPTAVTSSSCRSWSARRWGFTRATSSRRSRFSRR